MPDDFRIAQLQDFDGKRLSDSVPASTEGPPVTRRLTLEELLNAGRTGLVGGGTSNLDGVATLEEDVGQIWWVRIGITLYPYVLVAGSDAQDIPDVIRPLDFAADNLKVFKLVGAPLPQTSGQIVLGADIAPLSYASSGTVPATASIFMKVRFNGTLFLSPLFPA